MPSTGILEKALMWRKLLPHLLLFLLFPGSRVLSESQHLDGTVGQTLSVKCQYQPSGGPYQRKGWCKELSAFTCIRLVTSSKPLMLAQASRFSIFDHPNAGFFRVSMANLREEDSGYYWCRIYNPSDNSVSQSLRFYLKVSPAPSSTQVSRTPPDLVPSQAQSCVGPTARATETPPSSPAATALSQQQNCSLCSSHKATSTLVPAFTGLLVAKSLTLSALIVAVVKRHREGVSPRLLTHLDPRPLGASGRDRAVPPQKEALTTPVPQNPP